MIIIKKLLLIVSVVLSNSVLSLEPLQDDSLAQYSGQSGVAISAEIKLNEDGGPLNNSGGYWNSSCLGAEASDPECGARIAISSGSIESSNGLVVLDNVRGQITLKGLTIKTRYIDSGFDGDGAGFDKDVIEFGLPKEMKFEGVQAAVATANKARPTDAGYQQTDLLTVKMNASAIMTGNLLIFPSGN